MTTLKPTTLRPGLLVSLKTSVTGNVSYTRVNLEDETRANGEKFARWETARVITDPAEHERATKTRSKASNIIRGVCANSGFGLLCPETAVGKLDEAIRDAGKVVDEFNATAQLTRISVYTLVGRIAPDDAEAVRAIGSEVRELLAEMQDGLESLDVGRVRQAANKMRGLGSMLSEDAQSRIKDAIDAVRTSARRIRKSGETLSSAIEAQTLAALASARTAFLDVGDVVEVSAPEVQAHEIDLSPVEAGPEQPPMPPAPTFEMMA